jgi:hypothetical protein
MTEIRNYYKIVSAPSHWNLEIVWDLEFGIWDLSCLTFRTLQIGPLNSFLPSIMAQRFAVIRSILCLGIIDKIEVVDTIGPSL